MLVASPKAGVKNTTEFIEQVKKHPGQYSYGSSGVGTALHLAAEMVKQQGGNTRILRSDIKPEIDTNNRATFLVKVPKNTQAIFSFRERTEY